MIRKIILGVLLVGLTALTQNAQAGHKKKVASTKSWGRHGDVTETVADTTPGSDNAADSAYSGGWTNGTDGGTAATFNPWDLTNNNNNGTDTFAGYFIGDSTSGGSGDINTSGVSFGIYANPGNAFADAIRNFDGPLGVGQTFSLDMAVNFRNGNKGFNLYDGASEIFNFNIGGDMYSINGTDTGLGYDAASVFHLTLSQDSLTSGSYTVARGASTFTGSYTGDASGFKFYNSGTNGGGDGDSDNLYFNNLNVSAAVPEPATILLVGPTILAGMFYIRRRRA